MPVNMWFTKQSAGYKSWFILSYKNGKLISGIATGSFTVTVVDPQDTTFNSPSVSESVAKPGLYFFQVPPSFLESNGIGEYGITVEVDNGGSPVTRQSFGATLRVTQKDFDDDKYPGGCC